MSKIDDGGPAFPFAWEDANEYGIKFQFVELGMSLRDWFAGRAIASFAEVQFDGKANWAKVRAKWAYEQADAMLDARKQEPT